MKKVLCISPILLLILVANCFAQTKVLPKQVSTLSDRRVEEWYNPNDWLNYFVGGQVLPDSIAFLLPDSLAQIIDSVGVVSRNYNIALGQVIDPKDPLIAGSDDPGIQLSKFYNCLIDSFSLRYVYVRHVDSAFHPITNIYNKVVDTLEVYYVSSGKGLTKSGMMGTPPDYWYWQKPNWGKQTLTPINVIAMEKFMLTDADSTTVIGGNGGYENKWLTKTMFRKVGKSVTINLGENNFCGMIFKFKPGMSYNDSAVIICQRHPNSLPAYYKRVNYFGISYLVNTMPENNQWRFNNYFTHSLFSSSRQAYYDNLTKDSNAFKPGNAYSQGKHLHCNAFIEAWKSTGINDIDVFEISGLYPNPSTNQATLVINLKQAAEVRIGICNNIGQQQQKIQTAWLASGKHNLILNLNQFNSGVYIVNIVVNERLVIKKLVVSR